MASPKVRIILQSVSGGSSGFGISFWKSWLGCQERAARMEREYRERLRTKTPPPLSTNPALLTGTIVHALLEYYYSPPKERALKLDTTAISYMDDVGDPLDVAAESRLDAEAIFRAYRVEFPPDELGKVVAVEKFVGGEEVECALECAPFTCKIDLIVRIDKRAAHRLRRTRQIDIEPGLWLVDHKTDSFRNPLYESYYTDEVQFTAYMLAWYAKTGTAPKGMLVNILGKQSRPRFETIVIPFPSPDKQAVLASFLRLAQQRREEYDGRQCNVTLCYYPNPCPFRLQCRRGA